MTMSENLRHGNIDNATGNFWTMFHFIGGGVALVVLVFAITGCLCRRSRIIKGAPPSKDYLSEHEVKLRTPITNRRNDYTATVEMTSTVRGLEPVVINRRHDASDAAELIDDTLYSWGNDFYVMEEGSNSHDDHGFVYENVEPNQIDCYENMKF